MTEPYTEEDRFNYFARKNPTFLLFAERFSLELDYTKQFKGDNELVLEMTRLHSKDWIK